MSQENNIGENNYPNPLRRTISQPYVYLHMVQSIREYVDYIDYVNNMLFIDNIEEKIIEQVANDSVNESNIHKNKNVNLLIKKEKLKIKNFSENTKCCICISDFEVDEEVGITTCSHVFHYDCLIEWGKYKTSCPLCLQNIPFDNIINKEVNEDENDNKEENIEESKEVDTDEYEEEIKEDNPEEIDQNITILMSITNCSEDEALYSIYMNTNLENAILYLCE